MIVFHTPANFSSTTLSAAVAATDTLLNVNSLTLLQGASVFPFYAVIHPSANDYSSYEVVEIVAGSGTQISVVRAQDNSTATAFANGATIEQNPVAIYILELQAQIQSLQDKLDDMQEDYNQKILAIVQILQNAGIDFTCDNPEILLNLL